MFVLPDDIMEFFTELGMKHETRTDEPIHGILDDIMENITVEDMMAILKIINKWDKKD